MAKPITLKPTRNAAGKWQLNVPASVSPNGKRQRLFFDNQKLATLEADRLKAMSKQWGTEAPKIPADLAAEAARAAVILKPYGASLTEAAKLYAETMDARARSVTLAALWQEHTELKEGLSTAYAKEMDRISAAIFPKLGKRLVSEIDPGELERAIAAKFKTAAYFNLARRTLRPAFSLAVRRGYCAANPFDRIEKRRTPVKEIEVVSVAEMKAVLNACTNHRQNKQLHPSYRVDCTECRPAFAVMAFAGVRPKEVERLGWEDVNLEEGTLRIQGKHAKTRSARVIDLEDNLIAWLSTVPKSDRTGPLVPVHWARKYKTVRKASKIFDRQDVLRHSFASYHLAAFADVNRTRAAMGHEVGDVLFTNYRAIVSKKDAIKFWTITPEGTAVTLKASA